MKTTITTFALTALTTALASSVFAASPAAQPAPETLAEKPAIGATATAPVNATDEKDQLEQMLRTAKSREDLGMVLEKAGFRISSVNEDDKDELEYEVVKGDKSYEVKADFTDDGQTIEEVGVANNLWRAKETKQMMRDADYRPATPLAASPESRRYRDSNYKEGWTNEKTELEQAFAPNMSPADYQAKLEKMGYEISSVNEREDDHVEYEIVKGDQSYEVQIEMDPATKMGKSVDVSTNMWESDATEMKKKEK